jgi:hypothetical protein
MSRVTRGREDPKKKTKRKLQRCEVDDGDGVLHLLGSVSLSFSSFAPPCVALKSSACCYRPFAAPSNDVFGARFGACLIA